MKKHLILTIGLALTLGACGRGGDEKASAPKPTQTKTASKKPAPVRYDPAFKDIAGRWESSVDAVGKDKKLRIDVASGGGYSIDVRMPGNPEQVVETGHGTAKSSGDNVDATPDAGTKGAVITGLGAWKATVAGKKTMALKGADGKSINLEYKGL